LTAVLLLFAASVIFSSRIHQERQLLARNSARKPVDRGDLLAEISRRPTLAFGFRNFLGDFVWLKVVQLSGARRMSRQDYDQLHHLVDTAINFDPRFTMPYLLGGIILGDSPDHTREALQTLARGRMNHPSEWRFPFYIGYIRYFSLGDPIGGGNALMEASRVPGSAPYLSLLAARMLSEGREPETALAFLDEMLRQETRRDSLKRQLAGLQGAQPAPATVNPVPEPFQSSQADALTIAFKNFMSIAASLKASIDRELPAIEAVEEVDSGKAMILYADSILQQGAILDLGETIRRAAIFNGGTVIIYGKGETNAILSRMMRSANNSINIVTAEPKEIIDRYACGSDEARELDGLIRFSRAKGVREVQAPAHRPHELY